MDVEILSRAQFAFTIMFHYIFPPLSIGLAWLMVIMEGAYHRTKEPEYEQMARFFTKIFAIIFALGVASGIVMEFQFGTNWAVYSRYVGDVFGSALAAEGIFAFFLESGFLAVLVFGWDRVSKRFHMIATTIVACGATFSAVWIVIANSWMHTPAGFMIEGDGLGQRAVITSFWELVFNPSSVQRLTHVLVGAMIMGSFFVLSVTSYYIVKGRHLSFSKRAFKIALPVAIIFSLMAPFTGHFHAEQVAKTQPAKLAAYEGHFKQDGGGAPLWLFGIPSVEEERVKYGLAIPGGLSFLVHGDFSTPVPALDDFPEEDRPPVQIPFQMYHLMLYLGVFNLALTGWAGLQWYRGKVFDSPWLLWVFVFAVLSPAIANQAGWIAAEVGRQPWIVYGLLRTSEGLSESVKAGQVLWSIIMFGLIYTLLFSLWVYIMNEKIKNGPEPLADDGAPDEGFLDVAASRADPASPYKLSGKRQPSSED